MSLHELGCSRHTPHAESRRRSMAHPWVVVVRIAPNRCPCKTVEIFRLTASCPSLPNTGVVFLIRHLHSVLWGRSTNQECSP
jgi:hypothetical protein